MARSSKKGPYIDEKLAKKVAAQKQTGDRQVIKTWARASQISPDFVGHTFAVHNGRVFINVLIVEGMVGHRLGEFSPTRTFRSHGRVVSREVSKT
jgi:small subunit ribosomal protein S19